MFFMLDNDINTIRSTSAGRIFDAVSAILGIRNHSTFEGEASMYLEFAAQKWHEEHLGELPVPAISFNTDKIFTLLLQQRLAGEDCGKLAYLFHACLAAFIGAACLKVRVHTGLNTVALSGGVFQNHLLTELTTARLQERGFTVLRHSLLPPNDGGICLGQAAAAMYHLNHK